MTDYRRRALALHEAPDKERTAGYRVGPVLALAPDGTPAPEGEQPTSTAADVYVYESIGGWFGVSPSDFVRDVAPLDVDVLTIHLNSPGGSAPDGATIANVLRAHRARVIVRVDGMAASAASVIAMAADELIMSIGSTLMLHDVWTYVVGNAADLASEIRALDALSNSLAGAYAAKAGGTVAEWRQVMVAETWYSPEEAVAAGLADRVAAADEVATADGEQVVPGARSIGLWDLWDSLGDPDRHDLSAYRYAGRAHAPAPAMPGRTTPAASAAGRHPTERSGIVPNFLDDVRTRLGVPDAADETAVLAALDTRLTEPPRTAPPEGMALIERTTLDGLRADAQAGRDAHDRQLREDRERAVDGAIADGRIAPARRAAWLSKLEADPGEVDTLASLEKGLVPVDRPRGHAEHNESGTEEQAPSLQAGADLYGSRHGKKG